MKRFSEVPYILVQLWKEKYSNVKPDPGKLHACCKKKNMAETN